VDVDEETGRVSVSLYTSGDERRAWWSGQTGNIRHVAAIAIV
jgi:hypothetical protein